MSYIPVSSLRSPYKQKPKINFIFSPQVLKQKSLSYNHLSPIISPKNQLKNQQQKFSKISDKQNNFYLEVDQSNFKRYKFDSFHQQVQKKTQKSIENQNICLEKFKCQKCHEREQSYLIIENMMKYCSNCALQAMKNGKQIKSITLNHNENPVNKERCFQNSCSKKTIQQIEQQDNLLIQRIERNCQSLIQTMQKQLDQNKIIQDYNKKRQRLKNHYQILKQIIKQSIKKDLQNIKRKQQIQINQIRHRKKQSQKNFKQLSQIKQKVKLKKQKIKDLNKVKEYQTQLREYVYKIQEIVYKQQKFTHTEYELDNKENLYDEELFMLTSNKNSRILAWEDFGTRSSRSQSTKQFTFL